MEGETIAFCSCFISNSVLWEKVKSSVDDSEADLQYPIGITFFRIEYPPLMTHTE